MEKGCNENGNASDVPRRAHYYIIYCLLSLITKDYNHLISYRVYGKGQAITQEIGSLRGFEFFFSLLTNAGAHVNRPNSGLDAKVRGVSVDMGYLL